MLHLHNSCITNVKLKTPSPCKHYEELVKEINIMLQEKEREKSTFMIKEKEMKKSIANISHDLRTPLTAILGYIQLLNDGMVCEKERKDYLEIIESRTKVLQELITNFYELSIIESDEYNISLQNINLYNILCNSIALFYDTLIQKGFDVDVDIDMDTTIILGNKDAVVRIFSNLINNILKYGKDRVLISQKCFKNSIVTKFSNYAPDLNQYDINHIFDRFFTADRIRTGQNTGIGLTIVKELVNKMGHTVDAFYSNDIFTIQITWINNNNAVFTRNKN